jgi:hypothetical protein
MQKMLDRSDKSALVIVKFGNLLWAALCGGFEIVGLS